MLQTIQQFLLHTPWWVYLILAFLIYRGILATKTRIVSISKLFILPIFLVFLSAHTLLTMTTLTVSLLVEVVVNVLVGGLIGWYTTKMMEIKVDHKNSLMQIQGSWFLLWMLIIIFACKYYQGYVSAALPDLLQNMFYLHAMFALNGIIMGLLIGRLVHYVYCYKTKPSVTLQETA